MGTIKVTEVIGRVESILQDGGTRWPRLELQNWLNEAYLSIVLLRPDANAVTVEFACQAGSRQQLITTLSDTVRLLGIVRNTAAESTKKVVRVIDRSVLDDQRPSWHTGPGSLNIQNYVYDPKHPKEFYVYPPAKMGAELEIVYVSTPGRHNLTAEQLDPEAATTETIKIDDIYLSPITDWILYRAYSKDAELVANEQRAASSYQSFTTAIGAKTQTDAAVTPSAADSGA